MKDLLLIGLVIFAIVAIFGDGGLTISPELSPEMSAALNVNYAPDRSVTTTTIEQQIVGDYVENQTVMVQPVQPVPVAQPVQSSGGTIAEGRPGESCFLIPGDVVVIQGSNGECQVVNNGERYFVSPRGTRSWLHSQSDVTAEQAQPQPQPTAPATTIDGRWLAIVPLDELSIDQLKSNFKRNGGRLPLGFIFWTYDEQRTWLTAKPESWR